MTKRLLALPCKKEIRVPADKYLNSDDREDEMKEQINEQDVEDVFDGFNDAVEDIFQRRDAVDRLQGSQHSQHAAKSQRLDHIHVTLADDEGVDDVRPQRPDDDHEINHVPKIPTITPRMKEKPDVDDLQQHFRSKDRREDVVEMLQDAVAKGILVDGVLGGERDRRQANDDDDETIEGFGVDNTVGEDAQRVGRREEEKRGVLEDGWEGLGGSGRS